MHRTFISHLNTFSSVPYLLSSPLHLTHTIYPGMPAVDKYAMRWWEQTKRPLKTLFDPYFKVTTDTACLMTQHTDTPHRRAYLHVDLPLYFTLLCSILLYSTPLSPISFLLHIHHSSFTLLFFPLPFSSLFLRKLML